MTQVEKLYAELREVDKEKLFVWHVEEIRRLKNRIIELEETISGRYEQMEEDLE